MILVTIHEAAVVKS